MYTYVFEVQQIASGKIVVQSEKPKSAEAFAEIRPALEQIRHLEDFPGIKMSPQDQEVAVVGVSRTRTFTLPAKEAAEIVNRSYPSLSERFSEYAGAHVPEEWDTDKSICREF